MGPPRIEPAIRFWRHVEPEPNSGCWLWLGAVAGTYGRFHDGERSSQAHRFSYTLYRGAISPGLDLDHLCRNRLCVNPWHLEPVSRQENVTRGRAIHEACLYGHPYDTTVPSYSNTNGRRARRCSTCARAANERARAKRRMAA